LCAVLGAERGLTAPCGFCGAGNVALSRDGAEARCSRGVECWGGLTRGRPYRYEVLDGPGEEGNQEAISEVAGRKGKHSRKHKRRPPRSQAGAEQSGANLDELLAMRQRFQNVLDEDVRAEADVIAADGQTEG